MEIVSLLKKDDLLTKKSFEKSFLKLSHLLNILKTKELSNETVSTINSKIEALNSFKGNPNKYNSKLVINNHNIIELVRKNHEFVPENYYTNQWLAIGMSVFGISLGAVVGMMAKNMALLGLGLPIGMFIGIVIGKQKDKKMLQEGKQLKLNIEKS